MSKKKVNILRKDKPVIALICEGNNKTETKFFSHFNDRFNPYNLRIYPSTGTDADSMIMRANSIIKREDLSSERGDRIFCLVDLDMNREKGLRIREEMESSKNTFPVEFILSNPCFEVWLLYFFTDNPGVELISKNVKKQLKKHAPLYSEGLDIFKQYDLEEKLDTALDRAIKKNKQFIDETDLANRNPYTQVPELIDILLNYKIKE